MTKEDLSATWQSPRFDVVIASFAVARAGLGVFGEPIDPEGDRRTMAILKRALAKDGRLLITVPRGTAAVLYNAVRCYDEAKLSSLLDGWTIVEECEPVSGPYPVPLPENVQWKEYRMWFQGLVLTPKE
jgi:hypothetical protein